MKQTIYIFLLSAGLIIMTGCTNGSDTTNDEKAQTAWQRFKEANKAKDLERTLAILDSMEQAKIVRTAKADHLRGAAYDRGWQMKIAEHFYKKSYQGYASDPSQDWYSYADAGYRWAFLRFRRGDTEGAMNIIADLLPQAKGNEAFPKRTEAALLMLLADIQLQQHQFHEARLTGQKAYEAKQQNANHESRRGWGMAWVCMNISGIYHASGDIEGALAWLDRCAQGLEQAEREHDDSLVIEEWKGHVALQRALLLHESGHVAEASAIYAAIPRSRLMEPNAYSEAANYLMAAARYDEAADWYERLDSTYLATDGAKMTFDNIAARLSPRFMAYRKAGRNADALVLADSVCAAIDAALVWQKHNEATELAFIYQTYEKELALNDARSETRIHRVLLVAAILVILLIAYLLWRSHRYNKVVMAKNRKLYQLIQQQEQNSLGVCAPGGAVQPGYADEAVTALSPEEGAGVRLLYRRLCDLMDSPDHIYTDANLDRSRLAQLLGTNEHYVTDAISACSDGKSVNSFLNEYRLRYAAHLLATTNDSVALIAEFSGFSRSSFFRIFSEVYGMSPSDYRRAARE
jgi:AraC-like DNA-binding protein